MQCDARMLHAWCMLHVVRMLQGCCVVWLQNMVGLHITNESSGVLHRSTHISIHISIHICIHISIHMSMHMSIHMSIHMSMHMFIHMSIHVPVYIATCISVQHVNESSQCAAHVCPCAYTHVYAYVCTQVYAYVCTHACTHVCTHACTHVYTSACTGQIRSRQHLAGGVPWGCSGGTQGPCGDHLHPIQLRFHGNSCFEKLADFSCVMWICGGLAQCGPSALLVTKKASFGNKTCHLAIPPIMGQKMRNVKNIILYFFYLLWVQKWYFGSKNGVLGCFGPGAR